MTTVDSAIITDYYDLILKLCKEAGKLVLEGFHGAKEVVSKDGNTWDVVTEYDTKVEQFLMSEITKVYPGHLFIAEENSAATKVKPTLTSAPTWIIDPIDGTNNFVHGLPICCISVGLAVEKELVVGVVYNPMQQQLYTAIKGRGAYLNGSKIKPGNIKDLDSAVITTEPSLARFDFIRERTLSRFTEVAQRAQGIRSFGCAALTLCYIASGSTDGFFTDGLQCWDVAAGVLILEEAGGYVCSTDGGKFDMFSRTICSTASRSLANELVAVLKIADTKSAEKKQLAPK